MRDFATELTDRRHLELVFLLEFFFLIAVGILYSNVLPWRFPLLLNFL